MAEAEKEKRHRMGCLLNGAPFYAILCFIAGHLALRASFHGPHPRLRIYYQNPAYNILYYT
jgi:hypothetical protein